MKLGTRITLSTVTMVIVALGVYGVASVASRRAELLGDLERQTQVVGATVKVALEAAVHEFFYVDVRKLVARIQETNPPVAIAYLELQPSAPVPSVFVGPPTDGGAAAPHSDAGTAAAATADDTGEEAPQLAPPPPDPTRDARIRRIQIDGQPYGEHFERDGKSLYAYTLPILDDNGQVVAAVDLTRDESEALADLAVTERRVFYVIFAVGLVLALAVWLATRNALVRPLTRLVEGIDEVTVGDLTRVILRERDDEIGDLADRFNTMTAALREARAETERSVEARLALESRLRQSEKLATIGQLAASIAHEVGTPLAVIGGRARTLEKKSGEPAEVEKNAGIIAQQAARITRIIQRLLDFARKKAPARATVDVATMARDTIDLLEHQLVGARVTTRLAGWLPGDDAGAPESPAVDGDPDALVQVVINLVLNAMQAMPDGGQLEVAVSGAVRRKPGLDLAAMRPYVVLAVSDTGVGIPEAERERIFEPFYSTKQGAGGTGLGLAVSQGIVKDHDGWIEVDDRPGGGTTFRVFLPAAGEKAPS